MNPNVIVPVEINTQTIKPGSGYQRISGTVLTTGITRGRKITVDHPQTTGRAMFFDTIAELKQQLNVSVGLTGEAYNVKFDVEGSYSKTSSKKVAASYSLIELSRLERYEEIDTMALATIDGTSNPADVSESSDSVSSAPSPIDLQIVSKSIEEIRKGPAEDQKRFYELFGDRFISRVNYGKKLLAIIETTSKQKSKAIEWMIKANASIPLPKASVAIRTEISRLIEAIQDDKSTEIQIIAVGFDDPNFEMQVVKNIADLRSIVATFLTPPSENSSGSTSDNAEDNAKAPKSAKAPKAASSDNADNKAPKSAKQNKTVISFATSSYDELLNYDELNLTKRSFHDLQNQINIAQEFIKLIFKCQTKLEQQLNMLRYALNNVEVVKINAFDRDELTKKIREIKDIFLFLVQCRKEIYNNLFHEHLLSAYDIRIGIRLGQMFAAKEAMDTARKRVEPLAGDSEITNVVNQIDLYAELNKFIQCIEKLLNSIAYVQEETNIALNNANKNLSIAEAKKLTEDSELQEMILKIADDPEIKFKEFIKIRAEEEFEIAKKHLSEMIHANNHDEAVQAKDHLALAEQKKNEANLAYEKSLLNFKTIKRKYDLSVNLLERIRFAITVIAKRYEDLHNIKIQFNQIESIINKMKSLTYPIDILEIKINHQKLVELLDQFNDDLTSLNEPLFTDHQAGGSSSLSWMPEASSSVMLPNSSRLNALKLPSQFSWGEMAKSISKTIDEINAFSSPIIDFQNSALLVGVMSCPYPGLLTSGKSSPIDLTVPYEAHTMIFKAAHNNFRSQSGCGFSLFRKKSIKAAGSIESHKTLNRGLEDGSKCNVLTLNVLQDFLNKKTDSIIASLTTDYETRMYRQVYVRTNSRFSHHSPISTRGYPVISSWRSVFNRTNRFVVRIFAQIGKEAWMDDLIFPGELSLYLDQYFFNGDHTPKVALPRIDFTETAPQPKTIGAIKTECSTTQEKQSSQSLRDYIGISFDYENQSYQVRQTRGDGACGLHSLLGKKLQLPEGWVYVFDPKAEQTSPTPFSSSNANTTSIELTEKTFPEKYAEAAKRDFHEKLEQALSSKLIEAEFFEVLKDYLQLRKRDLETRSLDASYEAEQIFNEYDAKLYEIINNSQTLSEQITNAKKEAAAIIGEFLSENKVVVASTSLSNLEISPIPPAPTPSSSSPLDSPQQNNQEWLDQFRNSNNKLFKYIDESGLDSVLETFSFPAIIKTKLQNLKYEIDTYSKTLDSSLMDFMNENITDIKSNYLNAILQHRYYFSDKELDIAAKLYQITGIIIPVIGEKIRPDLPVPLNTKLENEPDVIIVHKGNHYSRCDRVKRSYNPYMQQQRLLRPPPLPKFAISAKKAETSLIPNFRSSKKETDSDKGNKPDPTVTPTPTSSTSPSASDSPTPSSKPEKTLMERFFGPKQDSKSSPSSETQRDPVELSSQPTLPKPTPDSDPHSSSNPPTPPHPPSPSSVVSEPTHHDGGGATNRVVDLAGTSPTDSLAVSST